MQTLECNQQKTDWLASGSHTVLRPVLEADLPQLACLLAEAPLGIEDGPCPWTGPRLRRRFEDPANPGLWDGNRKLYVATTRDDLVVGYFHEILCNTGGTVIRFHIGDSVESRATVGRDAVAVYLGMARRWNSLPRVSANVLACEQLKRDWLESAGFQLEITCREGVFHAGRPQDYLIYGWVADWAQANRAGAEE